MESVPTQKLIPNKHIASKYRITNTLYEFMYLNDTGGKGGSVAVTFNENDRTHSFNVRALLKLSYILLFLLTLSVAHFLKPNFEFLRSFKVFLQKFYDNFIIDTNKSLLQNNSILIPFNSIN